MQSNPRRMGPNAVCGSPNIRGLGSQSHVERCLAARFALRAHNRSRLIAIASRSAALAPHSACVMAFEIGIGSELTAQNHPDLAAGAETEKSSSKSLPPTSSIAVSSRRDDLDDGIVRPERPHSEQRPCSPPSTCTTLGAVGMPSLSSQPNQQRAGLSSLVEFGGNDFSP